MRKRIIKISCIVLFISTLFAIMSFSSFASTNKNIMENTTNKEESIDKTLEINNAKSDKELIEENSKDKSTINENKENMQKEEKASTEKEADKLLLNENSLEKSKGVVANIKESAKDEKENKEETPKSAEIEQGVYTIESCIKDNMVLDIAGISNDNNANVELWQDNRGKNQRFEIEKADDNSYVITAYNSGKVITAESEKKKTGTNIKQYEYLNKDTQKWIIVEKAPNIFSFICVANGLYLDANGAVANNGTNIQLWSQNNSGAQDFRLKKMGLPNQKKLNLENGIYYIKSAINNDMVLDVSWGSNENGANIELWKNNKGLNQRFEIEYQDGYYTIKAVHSGKYLDAHDSGIKLGTNIEQFEYNGGENQKWIIKQVENGYYTIASKYSGLYVDANGAVANNGTNIQLWEKNGSVAQKFKIVEVYVAKKTIDDGTYQIMSILNNSKVIDIESGSMDNGGNLLLWENKNGLNQYFNVRYLEDGYYSIISVNSGKALDVHGLGKSNGTNVEQYYFNLGDNQRWIIQISEEDKDSFNIISKCNDLFLDLNGAYDGSNLYVWEDNGNATQRFRFIKVQTKSERCFTDNIYEIKASNVSGMVLDVTGNSSDENANIELWQRNGGLNQRFKFEYKDGTYIIIAQNSNKALTVEKNNVIQKSLRNKENQKWVIQNYGNENYRIVSISTGLYMEIDGKVEAGANIKVGNKNDNGLQIFKIPSIKKITIVLNPGHGGKDTGCVGWSGLMEKNITLKISQFLRDELNKSSNYNIILTHEGLEDWDEMSLTTRADIARNNNADVYVSLHINAEQSNTASGSMMFVPYYEGTRHYSSSMSRLGNLIQDQLESIGINKHSSKPIIKKCETETSWFQYLENGNIVQADYYADIRFAMKGTDGGYGPDLTTETGVPAILVEHCFINTDASFVANDDAIRKIAQADANAIREYFDTY